MLLHLRPLVNSAMMNEYIDRSQSKDKKTKASLLYRSVVNTPRQVFLWKIKSTNTHGLGYLHAQRILENYNCPRCSASWAVWPCGSHPPHIERMRLNAGLLLQRSHPERELHSQEWPRLGMPRLLQRRPLQLSRQGRPTTVYLLIKRSNDSEDGTWSVSVDAWLDASVDLSVCVFLSVFLYWCLDLSACVCLAQSVFLLDDGNNADDDT